MSQSGFSLPQIMTPIIAAALSAMVAWIFKLDDRVFTLSAEVARRSDVLRIEEKLTALSNTLQEDRLKYANPKSPPYEGGTGLNR